MLKNEHECSNININAQNWALMTKNEHLCPNFEHFFHTLRLIKLYHLKFSFVWDDNTRRRVRSLLPSRIMVFRGSCCKSCSYEISKCFSQAVDCTLFSFDGECEHSYASVRNKLCSVKKE